LPCSSTERYPASDSVRCTNRTAWEAGHSNRRQGKHRLVSTCGVSHSTAQTQPSTA
jgi:hypothetical protein